MKKLCPICDRDSAPKTAPFCSTRCADLDLGRWFTGRYALPVMEEDDTANQEDEDGL
jgi:endogenous inhibitor of DNA gyrase (YacG/DUF329 family)